MPEAPAGRQRPVGADVAEDEQGPGPRSLDDPRQLGVERSVRDRRHGAPGRGPVAGSRDSAGSPGRRTDGPDAIGRDLGVMAAEQAAARPLQPGRGDPTSQAGQAATGS